jgi:deoxyribonuclease IV
MKFGMKIWSTDQDIEYAKKNLEKGRFDFIEISAIINSFNKNVLSFLKEIPTIIHCDNSNVNLSDKDSYDNNVKAIRESQKFADYLDSEYIILHPGYNGNIESLNDLLLKFPDKRYCIENMPGRTIDMKYMCNGKTYLELMNIDSDNYCLDLNHAMKAAITLKRPYQELINDFLRLKPKILHISDGMFNTEKDEHLSIGKGEYDWDFIAQIIKRSHAKYITLETPRNSLNDDITNLNKIKRYIHH